MTQAYHPADLARECRVLCRYLLGREPTPYVITKYSSGHASLPHGERDGDTLERALLSTGAASPWMTGLADTYAAVWRRDALLRRKLVLLTAILEHSGETSAPFDEPIAQGRLGAIASLAWLGVRWAGRLVLAIAVFGPLHLATLAGGRRHA